LRIMIDTNVVISALLKQGSVPDCVLFDVCENHELILCTHIINECYDVARRRFPDKIGALENFFAELRYELVPAPKIGKMKIKDIKDQPILDAAIIHNVDILITGDKHFLELDPEFLQIITPSEYKEKYMDNIDV
jgi:uncharacterized protein